MQSNFKIVSIVDSSYFNFNDSHTTSICCSVLGVARRSSQIIDWGHWDYNYDREHGISGLRVVVEPVTVFVVVHKARSELQVPV